MVCPNQRSLPDPEIAVKEGGASSLTPETKLGVARQAEAVLGCLLQFTNAGLGAGKGRFAVEIKFFEPLTEEQEKALNTLRDRGKTTFSFDPDIRVGFSEQGNFTVCVAILPGPATDTFLVGVSKRHPKLDRRNKLQGQMLAFTRAFENVN